MHRLAALIILLILDLNHVYRY